MATRMQQRRGTAAEWTAADPVLAAGEIGYETDTGKFKFGDGTNTWSNLQAFSDASAIIGAAPSTLDTLEELATAIENNPTFYQGVADNAQGLEDLTVDIATLTEQLNAADDQVLTDAQAYTDDEISTLSGSVTIADTTLQANIDTVAADLVTQGTTLQASIDANEAAILQEATDRGTAIGDHNSETTGVHGIADTAALATKEYADNSADAAQLAAETTASGDATAKADAAQTAAEATASGYVSTHNSETTNVHGIADTSLLATTSDVSTAQGAAETYADGLAVNYDAAGSASTAQTAAQSFATTAVDTHNSDTTGVHGIADTSLLVTTAGATLTGKLTLDGDPTQALHAATKQYVDSAEAGLSTKPQVAAASTGNVAGTYDNGTDGVGATLNLGQLATLDIDGITSWSLLDGILLKDQTDASENGRWVVDQIGNDTDTDWILRRCSLCDTADEIPGAYIFVVDGATNEQTGWVLHVDNPATFVVGTDDIDAYQFAGAGSVTAGTNISVNGKEVSLVADPTLADATITNLDITNLVFADGTQTKVGVPSITPISEKTGSYTLSSSDERDTIVEVNSSSATTLTIPTDASLDFPVGTTLDVIQTGTGQVTIAGASGVTVNATPGLKLRTQWSSVTLLKRAANSWLVFGDTAA